MDTALLLWSRVISHTGLFNNIISDRYPKLTSALWTNLNIFFKTNLSFSTAYQPQTDGLAEGIIRNLDNMIRRFCAYGLQFKHSDGFTHHGCTMIPALELEYKIPIHSSTGQNLSQPQRMTLLCWCCGNYNLRPSWGRLATPYVYGQFGPFWCSMEFWPYHYSLAFYGPNHHLLRQAISCHLWPLWPILISPTPRPLSFFFGLGVLGPLALISVSGPPLFVRGSRV
ncbi:hypothetical protein O181_048634 [Austropuccinia psidii MF-1]|uniref:Integrase catalytic domain-containing protein n=1 Tax=Austropuccinia psidii MF-1 TaxID=1389203 RepID=A0A9Q3DTD0_9BASI|nr:hypothetical protein [Austropuccinia psidii MF-1]